MVSSVGSISIDLSTNAHKFADGFKRSATTVERESARMSKAVSGFGKGLSNIGAGFVGGIAGGIVTQAFGSLSGAIGKATQALSDFEAIGNKAKTTGLSTDFFQALSFGAAQADVEQETLNKSLEIFAKNVGLAREGTGALYSGLLQLNPELLKAVLTAGDQEQRLKLVAEAMRQTTDATQRAALATTIFGKGGADLVRVFGDGAASLDRFMATAREMGVIIPRELIERAGELDDKLTVLSKVIDVNISQALVHLAPLLVNGAEGMASFAQQINVAANALNQLVNNPSMATFDAFLKSIGKEGKSIDLGSRFIEFVNQTEIPLRSLEEIQAEIVETQKYLDDLIEQWLGGFEGARFEMVLARDKLAALKQEMIDTGNEAAVAGSKISKALLDFRMLEIRSQNVPAVPAGPTLPKVHYGNKLGKVEVDPDVMDDVEAAIDRETEATKKAPYITGRYVDEFHRDTAGYFNGLNNTVSSGFSGLSSDMQGLSASITRMAEAGLGYTADRGFRFSGIGGSGSWAGRRYTSGGGASDFGDVYGMPMPGAVTDTSQITPAGGAQPISVSVVVKPVMEGTRLSGQSSAEIRQAAAAGTNAALRAFYGR